MLVDALTVPALLLATVLVVSGVAKVRAPEDTADAFVSLRLPGVLVRAGVPRLLPWGELALAALLVSAPRPLYAVATAAVLALFAAYLVVVGRAVRFPEPVSCACFGRLGLGTLTRVTVVRNLVLVLLATTALVDAVLHRGVAQRVAGFAGADWVWLTMVASAAVVAGLVVHGTAGPEWGPAATGRPGADTQDYLRVPIPFADLVDADGQRVTLRTLASTQARLLLFLNPGCGSCLRVLDKVPAFVAATPQLGTHAVVGNREAAAQLPGGLDTLIDEERALQSLFQVRTPAAVLLGADGRLAGGPVTGYAAVADLMDGIVEQLGTG